MSKSSAFASFADAAEPALASAHTASDQLTAAELLRLLQALIRKDPSAKDKPVFHVEFGSLAPSKKVASDEDGIVIS